MPGKSKRDVGRSLANDGGQRRVGSGWGLAAPKDHQDWLGQKNHYQTVGERLQGDDGNVVWMTADLTPAYTNSLSGPGQFAERTRRVAQYQRTFVYIRNLDLIVVHDQITSVDPRFDKRWLLHSIHAPSVDGANFQIRMPPDNATKMRGGYLLGRVLLPLDATLTPVGGEGYEYDVDGVNYDEGGAVQAQAAQKKNAEPGAWRLEVTPVSENYRHEFLVMLRVSSGSPLQLPDVNLLKTSESVALSLAGVDPQKIILPYGQKPVRVVH